MISSVISIIKSGLNACLGFFASINDSFFGSDGTYTFIFSVVSVWAVYRLIIKPFVGGAGASDGVKKMTGRKSKKDVSE